MFLYHCTSPLLKLVGPSFKSGSRSCLSSYTSLIYQSFKRPEYSNLNRDIYLPIRLLLITMVTTSKHVKSVICLSYFKGTVKIFTSRNCAPFPSQKNEPLYKISRILQRDSNEITLSSNMPNQTKIIVLPLKGVLHLLPPN